MEFNVNAKKTTKTHGDFADGHKTYKQKGGARQLQVISASGGALSIESLQIIIVMCFYFFLSTIAICFYR